MAIKKVISHSATCDGCQEEFTDFDFTIFTDIEDALYNSDWKIEEKKGELDGKKVWCQECWDGINDREELEED